MRTNMTFVYFADADEVVHKVPSDLTNFQPNEEAAPYVMDKFPVNTATGRVVEERVCTDYFTAFFEYLDEKASTFIVKKYPSPLLYIGDFVRFIGTAKSVSVITNFYEYNYVNVYSIVAERVVGSDYDAGKPVKFEYVTKRGQYMIEISYSSSGLRNLHEVDSNIADTLLDVIDVCEHTREIVKYVEETTNKIYARRLKKFLTSVADVLDDIRPCGCIAAMNLLMDDFHKIPLAVRYGWRRMPIAPVRGVFGPPLGAPEAPQALRGAFGAPAAQ